MQQESGDARDGAGASAGHRARTGTSTTTGTGTRTGNCSRSYADGCRRAGPRSGSCTGTGSSSNGRTRSSPDGRTRSSPDGRTRSSTDGRTRSSPDGRTRSSTDGRSSNDGRSTAAPPPAEPALTPAQISALNQAQRTIFFAYNSAALDKTATGALDDKVRLLKQYPRVRIAIAGNCDNRGTEAYNEALGEKRADAARDYMVAHGVAADRIDVSSNGSSQPVVRKDSEAAWAKNRNAQFSVIIPKQ